MLGPNEPTGYTPYSGFRSQLTIRNVSYTRHLAAKSEIQADILDALRRSKHTL